MSIKQWLKKHIRPKHMVWLRCLRGGYPVPFWGNLRRTKPLSCNFGFERGTPVDRFYLHKFLEQNKHFITKDVLEIQVSDCSKQYGHNVLQQHTVDIIPNFNPTYLCDLAQSEAIIPSNAYDCFLMPNTLCVLKDIQICLTQAQRILKPGGVILATTVSFAPLCPDVPDYWHMSKAGWEEIVKKSLNQCDVKIQSFGNSLIAMAAMLGLAMEELDPKEFEYQDPRFPVSITLWAQKRKN